MKLKVFKADGSSSTEKEFNIPTLEGDKGVQALKELLVAYHANRRQGNAKSKTRAEVAGTGKKSLRQKGSGGARHGDKLAPIYVGGGTAHGAKLRDWTKSVNKKARKLAFQRAIFDKASEGEISLIEKFEVSEPKTKLLDAVLTKIQPGGKILIVDQQFEDSTILAARNIGRVELSEATNVNAWDLVRYQSVLFSERGLEHLLARISGDQPAA